MALPDGGAARKGRAVERRVPAVAWLRGYRRNWLGADVIAGTTAAAVVIPQAMGYAAVAGMPVQVGVYTCIVPMVVYALLGTSRRLSFSTTSTIVVLVALALNEAGVRGADDVVAQATTLTLLVGVTLFVFWILRLGWVIEAVSEATMTGLKLGVGLTIMADQLPKLLGMSPADDGFFTDVGDAVSNLGDASAVTATLGFGTIAGLVALRQCAPRVPGPLVALVAGIGLTVLFDLGDNGVDLTAEVPTGLPLPAMPAFEHMDALAPYALAIAVMSYFESVTAGRLSRRSGDPPIDNNQEYIAVGAATVAGAFLQTVPPAGGFSQTQVNANAGARTQLSELVTVAWAIAIALLLAPVLSDLPAATLGAIIVVAVGGLISLPAFVRLGRIDRAELLVAVLTAAAALAANMLVGVIVGVVLTFWLVLRALNHPVIVELRRPPGGGELAPARPGDDAIPGMLVLRIEGGLYTLNVRRVQAGIYARVASGHPPPEVVLVDAGGTADISVTVMDAFAETDQQLAMSGSTLWVAALPTRALEKAERTAAWAAWVEAGKLHRTVSEAVDAHQRSGNGDHHAR